ncbi:MAG: hypothetical protein Q7T08_00980 [Devosia sp.]|nr:hypothetical protein [Devosia sp.]
MAQCAKLRKPGGVFQAGIPCREIVDVVRAIFEEVRVQRSPFPPPIPHGSFYAHLEARRPHAAVVTGLLG